MHQSFTCSDTSSIDHLVMSKFVSGPPRYHLAISGIRELSLLRIFTRSDTASIDHLVIREFVSGPPRYHLAIKVVREQFVN